MSDFEDSTVTYTTVSCPYERRSGDVSPGVYGPSIMPKDPYAYVVAVFQALPPPDYVPGPEEPKQAPPSPVYIPYVPEPVYPEYIPSKDDVFPAEEQPLPAATSPTADLLGYILEFDPDEDLEDDDDEDPEEDLADYPADHDDEEEEHPASADSIPPPPALRLLSSDCREDRPEVTLPPRKRLNIVHCPGYEAGEKAEIRQQRKEDIGYGIRDIWIDPRDVAEEVALTTLEGVNTRGHLATALGKIRALQAREQARAGAPEGAASTVVGFCIFISCIKNRLTDVIFSCDLKKMAPKKAASKQTTRLNPGATPNLNQAPSTTTITVTNAQLQAMIDQGVNIKLAARDANRTGDDSHTSRTGVRRTERVTRECTYHDFMKCQPLYFKGTEGVVELTQWFERMETVFRISNYLAENQIKFATCTLLAGALTWWNSHVRIVGNDAAYVMTWIELKKKITDKYCLRNEMKKIETELWNLEVEATEMATGLMDKKIRTYAERQAVNKRKFKDTSRNNQGQQQPPKRQDVARAYAAGSGNRQQDAKSFLAHVTTKETEGKSEKKRLENVPIVRDFPEVFPEDFLGLPPTRQVVFQIDLIPGAAP
nr:hypothetical protein [Tanacetum cinerariifolium]